MNTATVNRLPYEREPNEVESNMDVIVQLNDIQNMIIDAQRQLIASQRIFHDAFKRIESMRANVKARNSQIDRIGSCDRRKAA